MPETDHGHDRNPTRPAPRVFLLDAARQAQLPPARLLDLALRDPQLKLFIDQTGWVFDADRDDGDRNDHERVVEGQS